MSHVVKDAFWQISGRVASAIGGFLVIKLMTPYLWPIRYGDYSTILKYFAIRSALADFGVYVIALRELGKIRTKPQTTNYKLQTTSHIPHTNKEVWGMRYEGWNIELQSYYSKFVTSRFFMIFVIYSCALVLAYFIPSYTSNPYLIRGLPFGMLFSASFMAAGILQLPLQLFWKMEQVSIGLIIARVVQLLILIAGVYFIFPHPSFTNTWPIQPFLIILISVVASGVAQGAYVYRAGRTYMKLSRLRDWPFTKSLMSDNRQYGIAYYLSSFHTLIVLILLSIFFPTIQDYDFVGIWALALSLLEIMLIVPSSLGNSLIHKVAHQDKEQKSSSFGALLNIVVWISSIVALNFYWFATPIIHFVWGNKFLAWSTGIGSDTILPYLGIVLILSFIKQVFNYMFVANHLQNKLFWSNLFGVLIGLSIGIPLIYSYHLRGAIITQVILEIGFAWGAAWIWWKHKVLPRFDRKFLWLLALSCGMCIIIKYLASDYILWIQWWIVSGFLLNSILLLLRYRKLKITARFL